MHLHHFRDHGEGPTTAHVCGLLSPLHPRQQEPRSAAVVPHKLGPFPVLEHTLRAVVEADRGVVRGCVADPPVPPVAREGVAPRGAPPVAMQHEMVITVPKTCRWLNQI